MTILTCLDKKDFENILSNYQIGKYQSHKHLWIALQNTVYLIKTTKGKYILKIFENEKKEFHKYEVNIMDFVQKNKVSIPKIIKTNKQKSLLVYKNKDMILQRFVEGRHPRQFDNFLVKDCAKKIAQMNKTLLKLKLTENKNWKISQEFYPPKKLMRKVDDFDSRKELEKYLRDIKTIDKSKLRKSIIHADLCESNILVKNNSLTAIIDWDDAHRDYLVCEIAVFIGQCLIKKNEMNKDKIILFLKEYQKQIYLNHEEKKAVYYFIKHRYLAALAWCLKQRDTHTDKRDKIGKWVNEVIEKYKNFDKLPIEDFVSWF